MLERTVSSTIQSIICRSAFVALASISFAAVTPAQAPSVVRHVQFNVAADDSGWTTSGLLLRTGDIVAVRATGKISVSRYWFQVDANGSRAGTDGGLGNTYLEYRIGNGLEQPAGRQAVITAADSGLLQFRVSDSRYDDNDGTLLVDVVAIAGSSVPSPVASDDPATNLGGVLDTLRRSVQIIATLADQRFAATRQYGNPALDSRGKIPAGFTADGFLQDGNGYTVVVRHFAQPKARCSYAAGMRNWMDPSTPDRVIVCQWRDFDPRW